MFLLSACSGDLSAVDPAGPHAADVARIWWVMLAGGTLILIGVVGAALWSLKRGGVAVPERAMLVGGGLVFPFVTLAALMTWALWSGERLLARPDPAVPLVEAHAGQWLWEFRYPEAGLATQDVLHVPAGTIFHVRVTSADVIHSFWIPRLGGKIDAIPGKANLIRLRADAPGTYRGICAEYCGIGHATMDFTVEAHPPEAYAAALAAAGTRPAEQALRVIQPRREAARGTIAESYDRVLQWIGWR